MRIYLIGFMGSGKTHLGKRLAAQMNLKFIDMDDWIEDKARLSISQIFENKGEAYFRQLEAKALRSLGLNDNIIIASGGGTPCFHRNMDWINENGVSIYLNCSTDLLFQRLQKGREHRPLLKDKSDTELIKYIEDKTTERHPFYSKALIHLEIDQEDPKLIQKITDKVQGFFPNNDNK